MRTSNSIELGITCGQSIKSSKLLEDKQRDLILDIYFINKMGLFGISFSMQGIKLRCACLPT